MQHTRFLTFFIVCLLGLPLYGIPFQEEQNSDSIQIQETFQQGINLLFQGKFAEALSSLQEAQNWFFQEQDSARVLECHFYLGYFHTVQGKSEEFLQYHSKLSPYLDFSGSITCQILNFYGRAYTKLGDLEQANHYYSQAFEKAKASRNRTGTSESLLLRGDLLVKQGNFEEAMDHYRSILAYVLTDDGTGSNISLLSFLGYHGLGYTLKSKGDFAQSLSWYQKADSVHQSNPGLLSVAQTVALLNNLATVYIALGQDSLALSYLEQKREIEPAAYLARGDTYKHMGVAHTHLGNFDKAMEYLKQSKTQRETTYPYKNESRAKVLSAIGDLFLEMSQPDSAGHYYQAALRELVASFESQEILDLPQLTGIDYKITFLDVLIQKSKALEQMYLATQDRKQLASAYETALLASNWVDILRNEFFLEGSRLTLAKKAKEVYQLGMKYGYYLSLFSQETYDLSQLFSLSEKAKGLVLLDAFHSAQAKQLPNLPADSLAKELAISRKISYLETKLHSAKARKRTTEEQIFAINQQIFEARQSLKQLSEYFETVAPAYHELRYESPGFSLEDAQKELDKNQALIEYFLTDDLLFAFVLTQETAHLFSLPKIESLQEAIATFRQGIYGYYTTDPGKRSQALKKETETMYRDRGYQLYYSLIGKIKEEVELPEELIIIPDGVLGYLPFDALLSQPAAETEGLSFAAYPYLMKQHQISYSYSASLLHEMKAKKVNPQEQKVLGIGLTFASNGLKGFLRSYGTKGGPIEFPEIPYAAAEIAGLQEIVATTPLLNAQATEEEVRRMAPLYQVLHFSTHGYLDDEDSEFSFLAHHGAGKNPELGRLYVRELYTMQLQAEMVVLSACETGIGNLYEGEGIISMARGFSYAGAKSILTTLWSISDKHSQWIVHRFYEYLEEGHTKDQALRLARLAYMDSEEFLSSDAQHPFYWAAFTPIGDMSSIQIGRSYTWLWVLLGLGVVLLLWRRMRKNSPIRA